MQHYNCDTGPGHIKMILGSVLPLRQVGSPCFSKWHQIPEPPSLGDALPPCKVSNRLTEARLS